MASGLYWSHFETIDLYMPFFSSLSAGLQIQGIFRFCKFGTWRYPEGRNTVETIAVTSNIISSIYLLIIIIGLYSIRTEENENTRSFKACLWICFVGLIIDTLYYFLKGRTRNYFLIGTAYYLPIVLYDVLIVAYSFYLYTFIRQNTQKSSRRLMYIITAICSLDVVFSITGVILGKLFTFLNGTIISGPWNDYLFVCPFMCLIVYCVYLLRHINIISVSVLQICGLFFLLEFFTIIAWIIVPGLISGYIISAIALTVTYVLIQFKVISESSMQVEISNRLSVRDSLTGLKNRRGYDECLSSISKDEKVGAVFCDANSLKYVNDTFGHEAGDNLIRKVADILMEVFEGEEIFRISGDEFVVLIRNNVDSALSGKVNDLKRLFSESGRIASAGYNIGEGSRVIEVIKRAEQMMYLDKEEYYKDTGRQRRGI